MTAASTPTATDMMAAYAQDAVDHARGLGITLDYSFESVARVEELLAQMYRLRTKGFFARLFSRGPSDDTLLTIAKMYGGYVGEVLRRARGGEWFLDEAVSPGQATIALRSGDQRIWPPSRVGKRLYNGPEDNVWQYFQVVSETWPSAT
jgi:hypothetical protein